MQNGRSVDMGTSPVKKGILGGTFNPVHVGHLHLAQAAVQALELDQLVFIPSSSPPHKSTLGLCPFEHRFAMLEIAIAPYPEFTVSGVEAKRAGFSYTIDTLRELHNGPADHGELFFIMGFDAFVEMGSWKAYRQIPDYATIVVCERDGNEIRTVATQLFGANGTAVLPLELSEKQVSSSLVRELLAEDRRGASLHLPPGVMRYIEEHDLFR